MRITRLGKALGLILSAGFIICSTLPLVATALFSVSTRWVTTALPEGVSLDSYEAMLRENLFFPSLVRSTLLACGTLVIVVIGVTWLCVRIIDLVFKLKQKQLAITSAEKISMVPLGRKLSKIMVVIAGTLVIFYIAGINVAAALTGLGIGGIAIAFAAQKTLENLCGGIMIISDPTHPCGRLLPGGRLHWFRGKYRSAIDSYPNAQRNGCVGSERPARSDES